MREIILKGSEIQSGGRAIKLKNIVVRRDIALPLLGERVTAVNEETAEIYTGKVTWINIADHTYDAELNKRIRRVA